MGSGNYRRAIRDDYNVNCDVAREALSARIDGEREPVPAARVDEHLEGCAECRAWREGVAAQAAALRGLASPAPVAAVTAGSSRRVRGPLAGIGWQRCALLAVGLAQSAVGAAQAVGLQLGLHTGPHTGGGHLLNESTAWTLTIGLAMVAAALRPVLAAGLAAVLSAFTVVLAGYVVADALAEAVTPERVMSHLPILLGAVFAALVWRHEASSPPSPDHAQRQLEIDLPPNASHGRRRGHLWPTDGSAA